MRVRVESRSGFKQAVCIKDEVEGRTGRILLPEPAFSDGNDGADLDAIFDRMTSE